MLGKIVHVLWDPTGVVHARVDDIQMVSMSLLLHKWAQTECQ